MLNLLVLILSEYKTLFLLGKNEEVQAKLRAEVAPVLAEHPNPSHKILNSMPYLDGVMFV